MQTMSCGVTSCEQRAIVNLVCVESRIITAERWLCMDHCDAFLESYYSGEYDSTLGDEAVVDRLQVDIHSLVYDERQHSYIFLKSCSGDWRFAFASGHCELYGILNALRTPDSFPRPLTHRVFADTVVRLGGQLSDVVLDSYSPETQIYTAKARILHGGDVMLVDARPSDAIALAVIFEAPIFVSRAVLQYHTAGS